MRIAGDSQFYFAEKMLDMEPSELARDFSPFFK
jgi:hypothetical protein